MTVLRAVSCTLVVCSACTGERTPRPEPPASSSTSAVWTVTDTGTGPLRIGMTREEATSALGAEIELAGQDPKECAMIAVPGGKSPVLLMLVNDSLVRVDVADSLTATVNGLRVGSTEAEVMRVYGPALRVMPHKYDGGGAHYLVAVPANDSTRAVVFETDGERVTRYRAGRRPEVEWVEGCS